MRSVIAAAIGLGLAAALAACSQQNSASAPAEAAGSTAPAAEVQPRIVAGQIMSVSATQLTIASQDTLETVDLTPATVLMIARKGTLADIKPGSFLGTTNIPSGASSGSSTEVHIFPPGVRMGEGDRPMPAAPGGDSSSRMTNGTVSAAAPAESSRMTNGSVGDVAEKSGGIEMDVAYAGGTRHIVVSPDTPIQVMSSASPEQLKKGSAVVVGVVPGDKDSKVAAFVNIEP